MTAARRVIGRDGFAAATVGTITREAGASLGLLNYHFGSKDEVVAEAFAAAAREDLASLEAISRRFEDPADRLAAYLDQSEWADSESWRLWVDAWGESVHSPLVRDTLGRFDVGWRAVLAEVLADGVRQGRWACADPQDTAARLVAVLDGIGLHTTVHGEDVPPERAAAWARRLAELELGVVAARSAAASAGPGRRASPHVPDRDPSARPRRPRPRRPRGALHVPGGGARRVARRARARTRSSRTSPSATAARWSRDAVTVTCTLDAVGRASFRTRETVSTDERGVAVEAATTLEVPGRALTRTSARSSGDEARCASDAVAGLARAPARAAPLAAPRRARAYGRARLATSRAAASPRASGRDAQVRGDRPRSRSRARSIGIAGSSVSARMP